MKFRPNQPSGCRKDIWELATTTVLPTMTVWFGLKFKGPGNPIHVMSNRTGYLTKLFSGQAYIQKRLTDIVQILLPETDSCPSWINKYERMTVENISWSISTKQCWRQGDYQTHCLLITNRIHIQLSHRGWPNNVKQLTINHPELPMRLAALVS